MISVNLSKYIYEVEVLSIYDGDTIRVAINLGFGIVWKGYKNKGVKLRLFGIDTPELRGAERVSGLLSRDALKEKLEGRKVILKTELDKTGKYGRYLAHIYVIENEETIYINEWLVNEGLAIKRNY